MENQLDYKAIGRLDMFDPKIHFVHKMNKVALVAIMAISAVGLVLNYVLRIMGEPGGQYLIFCIISVFLCVVYIYMHEFLHAFAIIIIKHEKPRIKFGKLVAFCGSNTIVFSKAQYFAVASFPFIFFCAALIPMCILLPGMYFPLMFVPLAYNIFGSIGDFYMIHRAMIMPKHSVVIDKGTEIVLYAPIMPEN